MVGENEREREREFSFGVVSHVFFPSYLSLFFFSLYLSRVQRHSVSDAVHPRLAVDPGELIGAGSRAAVVAVVGALEREFFLERREKKRREKNGGRG